MDFKDQRGNMRSEQEIASHIDQGSFIGMGQSGMDDMFEMLRKEYYPKAEWPYGTEVELVSVPAEHKGRLVPGAKGQTIGCIKKKGKDEIYAVYFYDIKLDRGDGVMIPMLGFIFRRFLEKINES